MYLYIQSHSLGKDQVRLTYLGEKKTPGEQAFVHMPATTSPGSSSAASETGWDWACWRQGKEPAGPQHGTVWDLTHLTEANLNHMLIVRKEPAFRDFDCRVQLQQKKTTSGRVPAPLLHLGRIQGRENARGSLTFWDGANEEFRSESLQTLGEFRSKSVLSSFTLLPCCGISFHLALRPCFSRSSRGNVLVSVLSNILGNGSESWNLTKSYV